MAVRKKKTEVRPSPSDASVPPPVAMGYANVQSLGHVVDEFMHHSRDGEAVEAFSLERDQDGSDDPEPIEPPPPVPDGDDHGTRGGDQGESETK
jgi:hypothetical protein